MFVGKDQVAVGDFEFRKRLRRRLCHEQRKMECAGAQGSGALGSMGRMAALLINVAAEVQAVSTKSGSVRKRGACDVHTPLCLRNSAHKRCGTASFMRRT